MVHQALQCPLVALKLLLNLGISFTSCSTIAKGACLKLGKQKKLIEPSLKAWARNRLICSSLATIPLQENSHVAWFVSPSPTGTFELDKQVPIVDYTPTLSQ